ncbi:hypothetical protein [uncultured Microbacterium sp.]|uniref:hypothetical protein n=1 Tax=uncultured Microbacterium sp. TaxID=191216 RepID=UPI0025F46BBE|nr:hypothetical protein [uncultured Microbacterium sp.]
MPSTGDINNSINTVIADSLNTTSDVTEDNSVNTDASATDSFNTDNSVTDASSTTTDVNGSFNEDSNNEFNEWVDSNNTATDSSINDSYNETNLDYADGSYNTDNSVTDNSVNAGVREYNTGFGAWGGASAAESGAAGGSGHTEIWSNSTILDQSVNQNIAADGVVGQTFGNSAVAASGEGSIAAGGSVDWNYEVDESTNMFAGGDINIGNETTVTTVVDSYNEYTSDYSYTDNSTVIDVTDSFNDFSEDYSADGSFNTSEVFDTDTTIEVNIDATVDSFNSIDTTLPIF